MPYLNLDSKRTQYKNDKHALAIVKGSEKSPSYNKMLYINADPKRATPNTIEIDDDTVFQILPSTSPDKRDVVYVAGASGSGKSYQAKSFAQNYYKLWPSRKIYLVSKLEHDETIDSCNAPIERVPLDTLQEGKLDINQLSNSLIIFDDYDTISGQAGKNVHELINDIATMGRKHSENQGCISMLCLTHSITNYSKTRLILNECTGYILYPQNTSYHQLRYLCQTYIGLDQKQVRNLRSLGRWTYFKKGYPQILISSQKATILHCD